MKPCHACELISRRDAGLAPLWDSILRTGLWDVVHNNSTALPGWLVIVTRRHIAAIDELTEEEAVELGTLLRRGSLALKRVIGCDKTYVAQFAEQEGYRHVHFHLIPRMADQPPEYRGPSIFALSGVLDEQRVSDTKMNEIATAIRAILLGLER